MRPSVRHLPRWSWAAVLPLIAVAPACETVSVATIDVISVDVDPAATTLLVNESESLAATARASSGSVVRGRAVSWASLDPDVATVDSEGMVQAVSAGTATIQATVDGVTGTASVTVAPPAALELSEETVALTAPFGGGPTPARSVTVRTSDGSPVSGLSAGFAVQPASWLEFALTSTTTPATLDVRGLPAGLATGTYRATIAVTGASPNVLPGTLEVTLRVGEAPPEIVIDPSTLSLAADQGRSPPPPRQVNVTNGGGGTLSGLRFAVEYAAGSGSGWLVASLDRTSAPAVLSVGVEPTSLSPGVYDAAIEIEAGSVPGASATVQVRFRYGEPPPEIDLGSHELVWDVLEGTASIAPQTVSVTNRGSGALTSLTSSVIYPPTGLTGWLSAGVTPSTAPATLNVSVVDPGFLPGEYRATVNVQSPSAINSPQSVAVLVRVRPRASPERSTITAVPTSIPANGTSTSLVTVRLIDPRGHPVTSIGHAVTMSTTAGTLGPVQVAGAGVYTAQLTSPRAAGSATVSASVDGTALTRTATVTFVAGPPSATASTLTAAPTSIVADGTSTSTITLRLRDANGTPTTAPANAVVAFATTAGTLGPVTNQGGGVYVATLRSTTAVGVANVTATLGGNAIAGPVSVSFVAAPPSATTSTLTAAPTSIVANGTSTSTITLQLRNASGTPTSAPPNATVAFATTAGTLGPVTNPGTGLYVATLRSTTAVGVANVTATLGGSAIAGPVTVSFVGGPPTASTSTLTAAPTSIIANGTSTSTITLQLRDANGNPTTAPQNVSFVTTRGTLGPVTNPGTGLYLVALRSTTSVGIANVTARLGNTTFEGPVSVNFVAGPAAGVQLTGPKNALPLLPSAPLTLTIVDASGNATTSTSAERFTLSNSGTPGVFDPPSPITIPAGSQSATFTFIGFQNNGTRTITATWLSGGPTPLGSASHEIKY